jgi:hypothetical protein
MASYYSSSTFGAPGPQYGGQYMYPSAPKKPASSSPYGPGIYYDPIVGNPNDPTLGTLQPPYAAPAPHETGQQLGVMPQQPARPAIDFSHIDYSNDPILARVKALAEESIGQANADARANRTRLAIGLGDPELVDKLGLGGDVRKQAAENTFGTFQELQRQLDRRNVFDITGNLSDKHNLFYSTERGRELGLSGEQFLRDRSTATNAVQGQLATISQQLIAAKMAAQAQIIAAEQSAYERALQQALYSAGVG